jgi:hypothetical protein
MGREEIRKLKKDPKVTRCLDQLVKLTFDKYEREISQAYLDITVFGEAGKWVTKDGEIKYIAIGKENDAGQLS